MLTAEKYCSCCLTVRTVKISPVMGINHMHTQVLQVNLAQHNQRNKPSTKWKSNIIAFKLLRKTQTLCLHTLIKQCKETVWAPGRWGGKCSLLHFGHWPALLRSVSMWLSKKKGKDYSQQAACTEVPSFTGLRLFSLFLKMSFFFYFSSSFLNSIKNTNFISQFKCLCLAP